MSDERPATVAAACLRALRRDLFAVVTSYRCAAIVLVLDHDTMLAVEGLNMESPAAVADLLRAAADKMEAGGWESEPPLVS